jgi:hypothetical protein
MPITARIVITVPTIVVISLVTVVPMVTATVRVAIIAGFVAINRCTGGFHHYGTRIAALMMHEASRTGERYCGHYQRRECPLNRFHIRSLLSTIKESLKSG